MPEKFEHLIKGMRHETNLGLMFPIPSELQIFLYKSRLVPKFLATFG